MCWTLKPLRKWQTYKVSEFYLCCCHTSEIFCATGPNSKAGCVLCDTAPGQSRHGCFLDSVVYLGARGQLHQRHPFRFVGASGQCCPEGYYDGSGGSVAALKKMCDESIKRRERSQNKKTKSESFDGCEGSTPLSDINPDSGTNSDASSVTSSITSNKSGGERGINKPNNKSAVSNRKNRRKNNGASLSGSDQQIYTTWPEIGGCDGDAGSGDKLDALHNSKYTLLDLQKYLRPAHCDFRARKIHKRHDDKYYYNCAQKHIRHITKRKSFKQDKAEKKIPSKTKQREPSKSFRGIKGHCRWSSLKSTGIAKAMSPDPFHVLENLFKTIISFVGGNDRSISEKTFSLLTVEKRFVDVRPPEVTGYTSDDNSQHSDDSSIVGEKRKRTVAKNTEIVFSALSKETRVICEAAVKAAKVHDVRMKKAISKFKKSIPWIVQNPSQKMADAAHNCILFPTGTSDTFDSKNPFSGTSKLKGHDKIQFLTTFIMFDLSFTNFTDEYKNLMGIMSELISDITTTVIPLQMEFDESLGDISWLDLLFARTVEFLSALEMMAPDCVMQYTLHQLVEIVDTMKRLGPVRGWWAYPVERHVSTVKNTCPGGGMNPVKTMFDYCCMDEDSKKHNYVPNEKFIDNLGRYRDNHIQMKGKCHSLYWDDENTWTYDKFMDAVHNTLVTMEIDNLLRLSPFYRLYSFFLDANNKKNFRTFVHKYVTLIDKDNDDNFNNVQQKRTTSKYQFANSFYNWINCLVSTDFDPDSGLFGEVINDDPHTIKNIECDALFACDFVTARELRDHFIANVYNTAVVKGIRLKARGWECSEEEKKPPNVETRYGHQIKNYPPVAEQNNLKLYWHTKNNFSTWCKYRKYKVADKDMRVEDAGKGYGQINYFFRFMLPSDKLIHGLPFANITARNVESRTVGSVFSYSRINLNSRHSAYNITDQFVCLNYIDSTAVGVCGVNAMEKPIMAHGSRVRKNLYVGKKYFDFDVDSINYLALIDLHPHRKYVNISFDDSKLLEEGC